LGKTTFDLKEDLRGVQLGAAFDKPEGKFHRFKAPLIVAALDEMVKLGVLLVLDASNGTYMLTQPLGTFTQTVQLTPYTTHLVADAFNFFARGTPTSYVANKLAVTDTDVQTIALICFSLRDQIDELHDLLAQHDIDPEGGDDDFPPLGADTPENN
jgi:hypothetical protein